MTHIPRLGPLNEGEGAASKRPGRPRPCAVLAQCDDIMSTTLAQVRGVDAEFGEVLREIDEVNQAVRDAHSARPTQLRTDILRLEARANPSPHGANR